MKQETVMFKHEPYIRTALYYETDQMGIIHHSNYIRWMEEARLDLLAKLGISYEQMERDGILIPVLGVSCNYQRVTKYNETVAIYCHITQFNGIKLEIGYEICSLNDKAVHVTGQSKHCFVGKDFKPISLKKANPALYEILHKEYENQSSDFINT